MQYKKCKNIRLFTLNELKFDKKAMILTYFINSNNWYKMHFSFEDGTLPFLSIIALRHGFATLERLNLKFELISKHTFELVKYVYRSLTTYHHSNGKPLAILYHDTDFSNEENQGAIVNFNLLRNTGEYIGYAEVS